MTTIPQHRNILPQRVVWFVVVVSLLLSPCALLGQRTTDFVRRFDRIWELTRDQFYDRQMHGADWEALRVKYRDRAVSAKDHREFQSVVNALLGELKASHTGYYTDEDMEFYMMRSVFSGDLQNHRAPHIGVMGNSQQGRFRVQAVLNDSPAHRAGVKPGDLILEADGKPFKTVGSFRGKTRSSVSLVVERPGAGRVILSVTPEETNLQRAFLEATRRSVRTILYQGKKIGYIQLWCMSHEQFRLALEEALTQKLADTDGLILDLRDGYGGNPFRYVDVLFRPVIQWREERRSGVTQSQRTGYDRPIVLLINSGTRSAKEFFAYQIKKTRRGALVGETTAGAFLGAMGTPISNDGYLVLPVVNLVLDEIRLEGAGVSPDVLVTDQDADAANERQMKKALETLYSRLQRRGEMYPDSGETVSTVLDQPSYRQIVR